MRGDKSRGETMTREVKIAVLVGSLRKASFSRRLAQAAVRLSNGGFAYEIVEIGALALYNQDFEDAGAPAPWVEFRNAIRAADGVLFVTPEYNRSVPAALKNALDVGSRPYGQSVWGGKPAGILSVSPGALGGFGANHHLRQSMVFLDMPAMAQPEAYVGHAANLVADDMTIPAEPSRKFIAAFVAAFEAWTRAHLPAKA
jgi:chromate reductase, NAD(P)H dehydrogenase (quinone)